MSILIDNPEIEARLNAIATARGTDPIEALASVLDERDELQGELDEETMASIGRGVADIEAGRHLSLEESREWVSAELERRIHDYQTRSSRKAATTSSA